MPHALTFESRIDRAGFRAWHRGTREADYIFGGYFDRYGGAWDEAGLAWFEALLDHDDPEVLEWIFGTGEPPASLAGPAMDLLRKLDYVDTVR